MPKLDEPITFNELPQNVDDACFFILDETIKRASNKKTHHVNQSEIDATTDNFNLFLSLIPHHPVDFDDSVSENLIKLFDDEENDLRYKNNVISCFSEIKESFEEEKNPLCAIKN